MRIAIVTAICAICLAAMVALGLRWADDIADARVWDELAVLSGPAEARFDPGMVDGLPDPAQRFFLNALSPGALLSRQAVLEIKGRLILGGEGAEPLEMSARQVLAPPYGFVWRLTTPSGIGGTDALGPGSNWSRFRLWGVVPVARGGGDQDHRRSAFGRMVGEALMWTPAALLPATRAGWSDLQWRGIDENTAEVLVSYGGMDQSARITVDADGALERVVFDRWSSENPQQVFQWQPFGAEVTWFGVFDGIRVPVALVGGNHFGTDGYDAFYTVTEIQVTFR